MYIKIKLLIMWYFFSGKLIMLKTLPAALKHINFVCSKTYEIHITMFLFLSIRNETLNPQLKFFSKKKCMKLSFLNSGLLYYFFLWSDHRKKTFCVPSLTLSLFEDLKSSLNKIKIQPVSYKRSLTFFLLWMYIRFTYLYIPA